jgi:hypothetical protein
MRFLNKNQENGLKRGEPNGLSGDFAVAIAHRKYFREMAKESKSFIYRSKDAHTTYIP